MRKGKTVVLIVNLGTPDSPSRWDVYTYLKEFLSDPRVIDINPVLRFLLVNGIIAPFRSGESSKIYKEVWTEEGSPLLLYSESFTSKLKKELGDDIHVELAMRYKNPSLTKKLLKIRGMKADRILVVPMFPQYASATTGSIHDKVMEVISTWETIPEINFINNFYNEDVFLDSFVKIGQKYNPENYEHILFSYHGLPQRHLVKSDPGNHCLKKENCCNSICDDNHFCYSAQCYETTRQLTEKLHIPKEKYSICFQSRLGKDPWTQPYTSDVIEELAEKGVKKVLVFCPAFVTDCLETTIEIGEEYNEEFVEKGGEKLDLVHSLNDEDFWVEGFSSYLRGYLNIGKTVTEKVSNNPTV